jgi:hypothetical protein
LRWLVWKVITQLYWRSHKIIYDTCVTREFVKDEDDYRDMRAILNLIILILYENLMGILYNFLIKILGSQRRIWYIFDLSEDKVSLDGSWLFLNEKKLFGASNKPIADVSDDEYISSSYFMELAIIKDYSIYNGLISTNIWYYNGRINPYRHTKRRSRSHIL